MNDRQDDALDILQTNAESEIRTLGQQYQSLNTYTQDMDLLIQRYNAKKSFLGYATHWYGEKTWWMKLIVSTVLIGVGILCQISFVSSCLISMALSFFFIEHHSKSKERNDIIAKDLRDQKRSLQNSLTYIRTTQEDFKKITLPLIDMNRQMRTVQEDLQEEISRAKNYLNQAEDTAKTLQIQVESFQQSQAELKTQLAEATQMLHTYHQIIAGGATSFSQTSQSFSATNKDFSKEVQKFQEIIKGMKIQLGELTVTTANLAHETTDIMTQSCWTVVKSPSAKVQNVQLENQAQQAQVDKVARSTDNETATAISLKKI
ncbi:MAG: hypothetical protein CK424_06530 [Legionella sp.]|nr:MAG: hypothetical protein CK424_06530 [Legionella sp.]